MKKLVIALSLLITSSLSLIAFEESWIDKSMEMGDDIPEEVKEIAMMYRGLEMDIEEIEDEMEEVSNDVKELKEMVQELTETCEKIKQEVAKK